MECQSCQKDENRNKQFHGIFKLIAFMSSKLKALGSTKPLLFTYAIMHQNHMS